MKHEHPHGDQGGRRHHRGRGRGHRHATRGSSQSRHSGRAARGDVRTAVLLLLEEEPMHGYQLMQSIADRTDGRWAPSPGAVYPTINALEDEGLVTVTADSGRKLVALTDDGRAQLDENREAWGDPFAGIEAEQGPDLRRLLFSLVEATKQVGRTGTDEQRVAAAKILADARRNLYLVLAGDEETADA
jgi:DNA-binding PadR family transcriptional regulator